MLIHHMKTLKNPVVHVANRTSVQVDKPSCASGIFIMDNKQDEVYISVVGYNSRYSVSNFGNVYSWITNRVLVKNKIGKYLGVTLCDSSGKKKIHTVHRLVAQHFIINLYNKPEVNHKDGVKYNNISTNLEWVTKSENGIHSYKLGLSKPNKTNLGNFGAKSFKTRAVSVFDINGNFLSNHDTQRDGARFYNISESSISECINGKKQSAGKLIWKSQL